MSAKAMMEKLSLRALLRALAAWAAAALVLTLCAALLVWRTEIGSGALGYLSSALSFLAACAAGLVSARRQGRGLLPALVTATALVLVLLTLGFLIRGEGAEPSALLSLVSFSYAGCLLGSMLAGSGKTGGKKRPAGSGRGKRRKFP